MSQSRVPRIEWTEAGPVLPESAAIRAGVEADYKAAFNRQDLDTSAGAPFGALASAETAIIEAKNAEVLLMANMFNPETSRGMWQDALGKLYFLTRHAARATVVPCECRGLVGTEIGITELAKADNGHLLKPVSPVRIPASGVIIANFECLETGPITMPKGAVNSIYKGVPGWDSITNLQAGVPGRDVETAAEFEERRRLSVSLHAQGNVAAIYSAVASAQGVLDLYVAENSSDEARTIKGVLVPPHSVYVSVSGGNPEDIAAAILAKKSGGCGMAGESKAIAYWTDPSGTNVPYEVSYHKAGNVAARVQVIVRDTGNIAADAIIRIKKYVVDNFYGRQQGSPFGPVIMGQALYGSRFVNSVVMAGASDIVSIKVSTGSDNNFYEYVEIPISDKFQLIEDDVQVEVLGKA